MPPFVQPDVGKRAEMLPRIYFHRNKPVDAFIPLQEEELQMLRDELAGRGKGNDLSAMGTFYTTSFSDRKSVV